MNFSLNGKIAILFARFWGVLALLFGLFIVYIAVYDILSAKISIEQIVIKVLLITFGIGFMLIGRFMLTTKMSTSNERNLKYKISRSKSGWVSARPLAERDKADK